MSGPTEPISLERFAEALKDLPLVSLRLKILEIRNSVSHLIYSNAELKPFAETDPPDEVCVEAIRENEVVLERMAGRISALKVEVETRGEKWEDFEAGVFERDPGEDEEQDRGVVPNGDATTANPSATTDRSHPAWSDGTFQVGTIRAGSNTTGGGGSLSDADLAKLIEERMRVLEGSDDEETDAGGENGLHL